MKFKIDKYGSLHILRDRGWVPQTCPHKAHYISSDMSLCGDNCPLFRINTIGSSEPNTVTLHICEVDYPNIKKEDIIYESEIEPEPESEIEDE